MGKPRKSATNRRPQTAKGRSFNRASKVRDRARDERRER